MSYKFAFSSKKMCPFVHFFLVSGTKLQKNIYICS